MKKNLRVIPKWINICLFIQKRSHMSVTFVELNSLSPVAFISIKRNCVVDLWCHQILCCNKWWINETFIPMFAGWAHGISWEYREGWYSLSILQQKFWQPFIPKAALANTHRGENIFLSRLWHWLYKIKQFVQTPEKRSL